MSTSHDTRSSRDAYGSQRHSIFQDWPYVAPAMTFILGSAAVVVALMYFAERYFRP